MRNRVVFHSTVCVSALARGDRGSVLAGGDDDYRRLLASQVFRSGTAHAGETVVIPVPLKAR